MAPPTSIRIPEALRRRIEVCAGEQRRTFSNMALFLIERGLELDAQDGGPIRVSGGEAQEPSTAPSPKADPPEGYPHFKPDPKQPHGRMK